MRSQPAKSCTGWQGRGPRQLPALPVRHQVAARHLALCLLHAGQIHKPTRLSTRRKARWQHKPVLCRLLQGRSTQLWLNQLRLKGLCLLLWYQTRLAQAQLPLQGLQAWRLA